RPGRPPLARPPPARARPRAPAAAAAVGAGRAAPAPRPGAAVAPDGPLLPARRDPGRAVLPRLRRRRPRAAGPRRRRGPGGPHAPAAGAHAGAVGDRPGGSALLLR